MPFLDDSGKAVIPRLWVESSDGHNFVLLKEFTFMTEAGEKIVAPIGSTSDGASTPREMWTEIPPFGVYWPAAFLHDVLYRQTDRPRSQCDEIFLEAMKSLDTPVIERDAIYEGVHLGGKWACESDRISNTQSCEE